MRKSKFTLSNGKEEFEGYTDGGLWNGWANVCLTQEQIKEFLDISPYDYRFIEDKQSSLVVFWADVIRTYPSSPLPTDDGDILEGYFLDGLEFIEVEE